MYIVYDLLLSLVLCGCASDVYLFHRSTGEVDKIFSRHKSEVLRVTINNINPLQVLIIPSLHFQIKKQTKNKKRKRNITLFL